MEPAEQVREYVNDHYIVPARAAGRRTIQVMSGPIHEALGLHRLLPCVCDALRARKFESKYGVHLIACYGPRHGATTTFIFEI